jgi:hypothetical protein
MNRTKQGKRIPLILFIPSGIRSLRCDFVVCLSSYGIADPSSLSIAAVGMSLIHSSGRSSRSVGMGRNCGPLTPIDT